MEDLANQESGQGDEWSVFRMIEQVAKIDAQRTASIFINSIIEGEDLLSVFEQIIVHAKKEDRKKLADFIVEGNDHFSYQAKFAKVLGKDEAMLLLNKLIELSNEIATLDPKVSEELNDRKCKSEMSLSV